jgi:hypothetical protein
MNNMQTPPQNEKVLVESPFVKEPDDENGFWWSFEVSDPETGNSFGASISPYALLHSLGEEHGEIDLLVCGCSDAGCAGLAHEKFECTDRFVHWSLTEHRRPLSWYFERSVYENGAIGMLHEIYVSRMGWQFNALEFNSYEDFKTNVDRFLEEKPQFKTIWDELEKPTS